MATTKTGKKKTQKKGSSSVTTGRTGATVAAAPAAGPSPGSPAPLDDTPLTLTAELGRTRVPLDRALQVGCQSLVELDKVVGDPVDILINGRLYARGEVVTVSENFGVRITEIVDGE